MPARDGLFAARGRFRVLSAGLGGARLSGEPDAAAALARRRAGQADFTSIMREKHHGNCFMIILIINLNYRILF